MDDENFIKLPRPDQHDSIAAHNYQPRVPGQGNSADEKTVELARMAQNGPPVVPYNQQRVSPAADRAASIPSGLQPPTMPPPMLPKPPRKTRKRLPLKVRISLTVLLILLLLGGGTFAFGYYFYYTNVQAPLGKFIHPVSRGADEPNNNTIPSDSNVAGKVWNILLLGSDNDAKYSFPALLTQVMMVVHVDTINNTVSMLSIPRDSWVTVPEVGGMHKID